MGVDELNTLTGLQIVPLVAPENQVAEILRKFSTDSTQALADVLKGVEDDDDVETMVDSIEEASLDQMLETAGRRSGGSHCELHHGGSDSKRGQ